MLIQQCPLRIKDVCEQECYLANIPKNQSKVRMKTKCVVSAMNKMLTHSILLLYNKSCRVSEKSKIKNVGIMTF